ncbi:MAG: hypothetical protein WBV60_14065 [Terriglobales bacterium]
MKRYQVEFIFGTGQYRIVNLINKTAMEGSLLGEIVNEQNCEQLFADVCAAMCMAGIAHDGNEIECITFPEGSTRTFSGGVA